MNEHDEEISESDAHWTATTARIHAQSNLLEARGRMCALRQLDDQDVPDDEAADDQLEAWIRETLPWMA